MQKVIQMRCITAGRNVTTTQYTKRDLTTLRWDFTL